LVKGIDRFLEDLDFDCRDLSREEFIEMTNGVIQFLERSGLRVEVKDKESSEQTLEINDKTIEVIFAWKWLLSLY